MPYFQPEQVAAKWDRVKAPGFVRSENRLPYIEWYMPKESNRTDICVLTVSGGGFRMTCDAERLQPAIDRLVAAGITVADITYRTPRPKGLPIHQTAWADVQRAVRIVRSEAAKRGYSPDKIGATGISAGAKAVLLVATSSLTSAYEKVDGIDEIPANLDFAVLQAPAYVLSDGEEGRNERSGDGDDIVIVPELRFDAKTCPMCFLHGGADMTSPLGSTKIFRRLREMGLPCDLHIFGGRWHGFHGDQNIGEAGEAYDHWWDRAMDFIMPPACGEPFPAEIPQGLVICEANGRHAEEAVERWENLWRKGVQTNLHIAGSRGPVVWSGRIREFLNRRVRTCED
jgi:acetyl esterase/lipase